MKTYGIIGSDGRVISTYRGDALGGILIPDSFLHRIDDLVLRRGEWEITPVVTPIGVAKASAKAKINAGAGNARARFITVASGQEVIYQLKLDDAKAFVASGYPVDSSEYPFVRSEADAQNISPAIAADFILARAKEWISIGARIETIRRTGLVAVDAAVDAVSVEAARDTALAGLDGVTASGSGEAPPHLNRT